VADVMLICDRVAEGYLEKLDRLREVESQTREIARTVEQKKNENIVLEKQLDAQLDTVEKQRRKIQELEKQLRDEQTRIERQEDAWSRQVSF